MANLRVANATANAMLDALVTKMNAGSGPAVIEFRTGTQPATADTAASGTLLGTLTFSDPAAGSAASRTITFSAITQDSSADASGDATWARIKDSDGNAILDCAVGESGAVDGDGDAVTITINEATIVSGGPIQMTSFTITFPV